MDALERIAVLADQQTMLQRLKQIIQIQSLVQMHKILEMLMNTYLSHIGDT